MSDHFQHQDTSISRINFLQYSEHHWQRIAGNEFAYCNRMRASDYISLFEQGGFDVCRCETEEDDEARQSLVEGFAVDPMFDNYGLDDLSATQLRVALRVKKRNKQGRYLS